MTLAARDPLPDPAPASDAAETLGAPCTVVRPQGAEAPIVFASPHSGRVYPGEMRAALSVPLIDLRRTEDAFVDELFAAVPRLGASLVAATYGRGFVDLNRDARELDAAMFRDGLPRAAGLPGPRVQAGLGCLPRVGAGGRPIYARPLSRAEGERRLSLVHDAYHATLGAEIERLREAHGIAILIDCHSMPSHQPGQRRLADMVLGDRFGTSCSARLTALAERQLRRLGYRVARNAPYAGGYTTRRYGRPTRGVHALQIEIRRDLYMDELRVCPSGGLDGLRSDLMTLACDLVAHARTLSQA